MKAKGLVLLKMDELNRHAETFGAELQHQKEIVQRLKETASYIADMIPDRESLDNLLWAVTADNTSFAYLLEEYWTSIPEGDSHHAQS